MKKVLIVDDQQTWVDFNKDIIKNIYENNVITDTALSAGDAYDLLLQNSLQPYDCIITDLQMEDAYAPKSAGEWLVEQAKNMPCCKNTNIIIVSAAPFISYIAETLQVNFIRKQDVVTSKKLFNKYLK